MTHPTPLDPELRVLLEEIAQDPKAKLFRTEIPRPERLVLQRVEPVGPAAVGLTAAERELVRAYREDVAKLLRDAAEWKLQQDPVGAAQVSVYPTAFGRREFPSAEALKGTLEARTKKVGQALFRGSTDVDTATAVALFSTWSTTPHQFAGLALRLVGHDAAWIQIGRALLLEGCARPALRTLAEVVRRDQRIGVRSSALTWIGIAYAKSACPREAARAYEMATRVDEPTPNSLLCALNQAVLAGEYERALRAAERVDPCLAPTAPGVLHWVAQQQRRAALGQSCRPSPEAAVTARELLGRVGPTSRTVLDALG